MCLDVSKKRTEYALATRKKGGYVTRYKILQLTRIALGRFTDPNMTRTRCSIALSSDNHRNFVWRPGENAAFEPEKFNPKEKDQTINSAIHVITTMKEAEARCTGNDYNVVVPVRCFNRDLIAVSRTGHCEECYTKVTLLECDHQIALNAVVDKSTAYEAKLAAKPSKVS